MASKSEKLGEVIREAVFDAIARVALSNPGDSAVLSKHASVIAYRVTNGLAYKPYGLLAITDIVKWHPRVRQDHPWMHDE